MQKTGCDGFHPKVPLDLTRETRGDVVEFLEKVELAQRCSSWSPKNVTSERQIALLPTLIHWWQTLRAPEVAKWQQKYRVDWEELSEQWEMLMEMDRFKGKAKE